MTIHNFYELGLTNSETARNYLSYITLHRTSVPNQVNGHNQVRCYCCIQFNYYAFRA